MRVYSIGWLVMWGVGRVFSEYRNNLWLFLAVITSLETNQYSYDLVSPNSFSARHPIPTSCLLSSTPPPLHPSLHLSALSHFRPPKMHFLFNFLHFISRQLKWILYSHVFYNNPNLCSVFYCISYKIIALNNC